MLFTFTDENITREVAMAVVEKLDELGKPAWIGLIILAFLAWWPLGLSILLFFLGSGRMGCFSHRGMYRGMDRFEHHMGRWQAKMERMQDRMDRLRGRMDRARGRCDWWGEPRSSGNRAFDDYRAETLRRLEEEQREFKEFLERLRFAKDRAEFDQFMAERRNRPPEGEGPRQQAG